MLLSVLHFALVEGESALKRGGEICAGAPLLALRRDEEKDEMLAIASPRKTYLLGMPEYRVPGGPCVRRISDGIFFPWNMLLV